MYVVEVGGQVPDHESLGVQPHDEGDSQPTVTRSGNANRFKGTQGGGARPA